MQLYYNNSWRKNGIFAKNTSIRRLSSDGGGSGTFDLYEIK